MNLKSYLQAQVGRSTIVKLLTGLDKDQRSTSDASGEVSLILEYIPLSVEGSSATLQVRTQLAIRNTPLLRRHPYREDIGSLTVSTQAQSLEEWYVQLAVAVMARLDDLPHASTTNAVAHWLSPHFNPANLKLALN
jgi:hypothetical protein